MSDNIVRIPQLNQMHLLHCDECESTIFNLFVSKDFLTLAYKCVSCGYTGYAINQVEEED